jgi:hypothetical protein
MDSSWNVFCLCMHAVNLGKQQARPEQKEFPVNSQKTLKWLWLAVGLLGLLFLGCGPGEVGLDFHAVGAAKISGEISYPGHLISRGMKGPEVEWIQERLSLWGHFIRPEGKDFNPPEHIGALDSNQSFGPMTEIAVSAFQAWNRMWADQDNSYFSQHTGMVDEVTWNALAQDPEFTSTNKPKFPGGVALGRLSRAQLVDYLMQQYEKCNIGNIAFNRDPGGVNFVQIRGFDHQDWVPIQNTYDEFNDPIFVLVNPDDCQAGSCSPAPDRLEVLRATADYGWMFPELWHGEFGFWRPGWMNYNLHPVLGPRHPRTTKDDLTSTCELCTEFDDQGECTSYSEQCVEGKGLDMTAANRVMLLQFGTHTSGSSGVYRGIALLDPYGDRTGAVRSYIDFNHNHQIDGLEWDYLVGDWARVGNNVHHAGSDTEHVGPYSAGCHAMAMDGSYQKFTKITLESGQMRDYLKSSYLTLDNIRGLRCNQPYQVIDLCVKYENSYVPYIDERTQDYREDTYIFAGHQGTAYNIHFPFLLLDSRDLDPLPLDGAQNSCAAQKGEACCDGGGCALGLTCMNGACFGPEGIAPWYACDPAAGSFLCQESSTCCECKKYGFFECDPQSVCSDPIHGVNCQQVCANTCGN